MENLHVITLNDEEVRSLQKLISWALKDASDLYEDTRLRKSIEEKLEKS